MAHRQLRHGGAAPLTLNTGVANAVPALDTDVLRVHEALLELESIDGDLVHVVEMRYFAGMSEEQIADAMQISARTVRRQWPQGAAFSCARRYPKPEHDPPARLHLKITGSQWKQLFGLLDTALELPPAQRPALLQQVAADDPELGDKLRRLLEANIDWDAAIADAAPLLEGMDTALPRGSFVAFAALAAGTQVGPYTLIRELGEGGMSTVWLAARSDGQMRRPLALKLPHVFMRTARLAERFEREREILESLSHPNIARLYDAGVTADGQPYLGMEYVEGVSLLNYSNDARRKVRERLQTFLQVLDAVRYAHSRLVIHRDLKPSNILVTAEHQVCLLDFGIAKLTVDGAAHETELTRHDGTSLDAGVRLARTDRRPAFEHEFRCVLPGRRVVRIADGTAALQAQTRFPRGARGCDLER